MAAVKTRAEKAAATRRRMREAAERLFVGQGYAATTVERIATEADVAVQTVYYTFKTKGALLAEIVDVAAAGEEDPIPVDHRPWLREAMTTPSAHRALALAVEHGTSIYDRVAHLWPALSAAAAVDPVVARYWNGVTDGRRAGQSALVRRIAETSELKTSVGRATDVLIVLLGHDVYRGLVLDAGWELPAYRGWLFYTLTDQLLGTESSATATVGLSFAASPR